MSGLNLVRGWKTQPNKCIVFVNLRFTGLTPKTISEIQAVSILNFLHSQNVFGSDEMCDSELSFAFYTSSADLAEK